MCVCVCVQRMKRPSDSTCCLDGILLLFNTLTPPQANKQNLLLVMEGSVRDGASPFLWCIGGG